MVAHYPAPTADCAGELCPRRPTFAAPTGSCSPAPAPEGGAASRGRHPGNRGTFRAGSAGGAGAGASAGATGGSRTAPPPEPPPVNDAAAAVTAVAGLVGGGDTATAPPLGLEAAVECVEAVGVSSGARPDASAWDRPTRPTPKCRTSPAMTSPRDDTGTRATREPPRRSSRDGSWDTPAATLASCMAFIHHGDAAATGAHSAAFCLPEHAVQQQHSARKSATEVGWAARWLPHRGGPVTKQHGGSAHQTATTPPLTVTPPGVRVRGHRRLHGTPWQQDTPCFVHSRCTNGGGRHPTSSSVTAKCRPSGRCGGKVARAGAMRLHTVHHSAE